MTLHPTFLATDTSPGWFMTLNLTIEPEFLYAVGGVALWFMAAIITSALLNEKVKGYPRQGGIALACLVFWPILLVAYYAKVALTWITERMERNANVKNPGD